MSTTKKCFVARAASRAAVAVKHLRHQPILTLQGACEGHLPLTAPPPSRPLALPLPPGSTAAARPCRSVRPCFRPAPPAACCPSGGESPLHFRRQAAAAAAGAKSTFECFQARSSSCMLPRRRHNTAAPPALGCCGGSRQGLFRNAQARFSGCMLPQRRPHSRLTRRGTARCAAPERSTPHGGLICTKPMDWTLLDAGQVRYAHAAPAAGSLRLTHTRQRMPVHKPVRQGNAGRQQQDEQGNRGESRRVTPGSRRPHR